MKRLVHIFNSIEYSGAEKMVFTLNYFYNKNYITQIISTGQTEGEFFHEYKDKFICNHIPVSNSRFKSYFIDLFKFISFYRNQKIDIVHIHPSRRFLFHVLAAKLGGVKTIIRQIHNNFEFSGYVKIKESLVRRLCRFLGAKIVSISSSVYNNELLRFNNKTILVSNFYDEDIIYPDILNNKEKFRKEFGIDNKSFVIISSGTCCDRKQHTHIIASVAEIKKTISEIFYIHLGNGEMELEEKNLCEKLGVTNNVFFAGNIDDVWRFLIMSDVYIITSKIEGLSIASIEAMGVGLPSILYDTPGTRDLGINDAPGIIIDPNIKSLVSKIIELYNLKINNPKKYKLISTMSYEYVIKYFSKKQAIINWKKVYFDSKN